MWTSDFTFTLWLFESFEGKFLSFIVFRCMIFRLAMETSGGALWAIGGGYADPRIAFQTGTRNFRKRS